MSAKQKIYIKYLLNVDRLLFIPIISVSLFHINQIKKSNYDNNRDKIPSKR